MLFDHEVHHYSLSLSLFVSCLLYGVPVARVSLLFFHVALFHYKLELRAFSVVEMVYIYEIKAKTTIGRIGVYKQIVGLF